MDLDTLRLIHHFPDLLAQVGLVASQMAEHEGWCGPWTWYDVRPLRRGGYVAFVYGRTLGQQRPFRFPVIPDKYSTDPENRVSREDEPYVFWGAVEAEAAARQAARVLLEQMRPMNAQIVEEASERMKFSGGERPSLRS